MVRFVCLHVASSSIAVVSDNLWRPNVALECGWSQLIQRCLHLLPSRPGIGRATEWLPQRHLQRRQSVHWCRCLYRPYVWVGPLRPISSSSFYCPGISSDARNPHDRSRPTHPWYSRWSLWFAELGRTRARSHVCWSSWERCLKSRTRSAESRLWSRSLGNLWTFREHSK